MEVNSDALSAALKMAGQNSADLDKTLRMIRSVQSIQKEGATPVTMLNLLAQYDPKYAAMAALMRALSNGETVNGKEPPADDGVQYNHF
jgi:hypothetical protein